MHREVKQQVARSAHGPERPPAFHPEIFETSTESDESRNFTHKHVYPDKKSQEHCSAICTTKIEV